MADAFVHKHRRARVVGVALCLMAVVCVAGCKMHVEAVSRPAYRLKGRVAVLGTLLRAHEELFIPLYMKAFPYQTLVERRDLLEIINEQDLSPERLREETRAKIRRILGVTAIVYPNFTDEPPGQLSIKVIDTESGEIVAAVLITRENEPLLGPKASPRRMIYKGVDALRVEANRHAKKAFWHLR